MLRHDGRSDTDSLTTAPSLQLQWSLDTAAGPDTMRMAAAAANVFPEAPCGVSAARETPRTEGAGRDSRESTDT